MYDNLVYRQKNELQRLISLPYIERLNPGDAQKWLDTGMVKVITGPRRAGKSVFALLMLKNRSFGYFNFDEEGLAALNNIDSDQLLKSMHVHYGETKTIFFDEIQNMPNWEVFVNRLQREGYNLVLTGSNSRLLSGELATALTGRHIPIAVYPFSFREFLNAKEMQINPEGFKLATEMAAIQRFAEEYLNHGGFPELTMKNMDPGGYLKILFDSVLFKDIVRRFKIRRAEQIDTLGSYLMDNAASLFTNRRLARLLGLKSDMTVEKYIRYLTETFLVYTLTRYSFKGSERLTAPRKIYSIDNGFILAKAIAHSTNREHLLENMVFSELVKAGMEPNRDLFYYQTRNNREVDFILKQGSRVTELIQVVYSASNIDTFDREIKSLMEASDELNVEKLTLVSWNEKNKVEKGSKTIQVVPAWEWMMKFQTS
ncbi:MAG: ATP-binding protein [Bacteroidota bacterium]